MKPILRDIPEEFETVRLLLRAPRPGDGAEAHAAIVESAERLRVWIPWAKPEITVEEEEINARERRIEIGYWIRTGYEGQGYVKETVEGLTQFAINLGARRIEIHTDSRNERSWRVAERAGFVLEGILQMTYRDVDGKLGDTRIYAKIRTEP